jgi:hypothetical protein
MSDKKDWERWLARERLLEPAYHEWCICGHNKRVHM